jgi:hypothetical protein
LTAGRYLLGLMILTVIMAPALGSAVMARRRLVAWDGARARLLESVLALAVLVVGAELSGAVGLLAPAPLVTAEGFVAVALVVLTRRVDRHDVEVDPQGPTSRRRLPAVVATLVVALAVGQWAARTLSAVDHGMPRDDTLHYHMPFAARFAQSGKIAPLHYTAPGEAAQFVPADAELLHAVAMLPFDRDILSPFFNLGWMLLTLLAGWVIGRPRGIEAATLVATAACTLTPVMLRYQPGTGLNDITDLFLLLATVAILVQPDAPPLTRIGLAGLAAGLGIGNKLSLVAPIGLLSIAVVVLAPSGRRIRSAGSWGAPLALTGGFWYLRNLVAVRNPIPTLRLGIGPLHLPAPHIAIVERFGSTVAEHLTDGETWRTLIRPGLRVSFGPAWPLVLGLAGAGMGLAVLRGRGWVRVLGIVAVASAVAYTITPLSVAESNGRAVLFAENTRWAHPALLLGFVLLMLASPARWRPVAIGLTAVAMGTMAAADGPWTGLPPEHRRAGVAAAVLVAVGAAAWAGRGHWPRWAMGSGLVVAALVVIVVGVREQRTYLEHRYADDAGVRGPAYRWARQVHRQRIAIAGFNQQYPLYGLDLSNHVQYVGRAHDHGAFSGARSCEELWSLLGHGRYTFLVTAPQFDEESPREATWAEAGGAGVVVSNGRMTVFRLPPAGPGTGCRTRTVQRTSP